MFEFLVVTLLLLLAAVFVLFPPMMQHSARTSSRSAINVDLFQQRLAELEVEHDSGELSTDAYQRLKIQQQRLLLSDAVQSPSFQPVSGKPRLPLLVGMLIVLPLLAFGVYQHTGARADWQIAENLRLVQAKLDAGEEAKVEMAALLRQITLRLEQQPENIHYLMLLASAGMQQQNYPDAVDAYQRLEALLPEDPSVLAQYAQALYLASDRSLTDKVRSLADRALSINPQHPGVLGMLGMASYEAGDFQSAITYWQHLLPQLPASSAEGAMIQSGIEQAQSLLPGHTEPTETAGAPVAAVSLDVSVALADHLNAANDASVFVFARPLSGSKMPLAVARLKVSELPARLTLDDSMALMPGLVLSAYEQVEVVARISNNGIADPASGDLEGRLRPVSVGGGGPWAVLIDQVLP
jgi:cytochrome c-type biogenesis protein CcmH